MHLGKATTKYFIPIGIFIFIALFFIGIKFFVIKVGIMGCKERSRTKRLRNWMAQSNFERRPMGSLR